MYAYMCAIVRVCDNTETVEFHQTLQFFAGFCGCHVRIHVCYSSRV
nr:MAG TPA: hypothetical protein [Caudoviricetes sp.]